MNLNLDDTNPIEDIDAEIEMTEQNNDEDEEEVEQEESEEQGDESCQSEGSDVDVNVSEVQDSDKCGTEEDIEEVVTKKTDNELVNDYLHANSRCILCTTPIWSLKVNKAYLDGKSYSEIINEFSQKIEERTGRSLNKSLLHRHFKSHFDARAAAISEYNKKRQDSIKSSPTSSSNKDIFKLLTNKYLDELEIFDATAKELIIKYNELEGLIDTKKEKNVTAGIDELILKQAQILNVLNKQAISKFKALSRANLEGKQSQFLSQLSFIGAKAITGSGTNQRLDARETEDIYLQVVVKQMLARLEDPLKAAFGTITNDQRLLFFRELKKSLTGVQEGITADFERQIKNSNEQKLLTSKQQNS